MFTECEIMYMYRHEYYKTRLSALISKKRSKIGNVSLDGRLTHCVLENKVVDTRTPLRNAQRICGLGSVYCNYMKGVL